MGSDVWLQWRAPRVSLHQRWYPRKTFFGGRLRIAELIAWTSLSWLFFSPLQIILLTWTTVKPFYKPQLFFLKTSPTSQTTPVPKGSLPWVSRALTSLPLLLKLICLFIGFKCKGECPCSLNISTYRKTHPCHWKQGLWKFLVCWLFFSPSARLPVFLVPFSTLFTLSFVHAPSFETGDQSIRMSQRKHRQPASSFSINLKHCL